MKDTSGLVKSLNGYLKWNKARATCFLNMLLGLFAVRTINLQEIALAFSSDAKVESRYRRLQRFFATFTIDFTQIARWIFKLYFCANKKFYLIVDRTNWYWGKKKINVFMLSIAHEGMAIPLFWIMLPKAGNSNFKEQKALLSNFIGEFGIDCIEGFLADREFASGKLFRWLNKKNIPFFIRIKEGSTVRIKTKKFTTAKKLFNHLNQKSKSEYQMKIWIFGAKAYLAGSRSERGELMIVATNKSPKNAIEIYLRRWEIETLFQCLKGRGFHFESTHITDLNRLKKLIAVLAIGSVWAHKVGEWKAEAKKIIQKQFKGQKRPQYSYFRYGLDAIRECIFQINTTQTVLKSVFSLIIPKTEGVV
jgi:hypothetical protein